MTDLDRAVRTLKRGEKRRRVNSVICVAIGLVVGALGIWGGRESAAALAHALEQSSGSSIPAISMAVPASTTMTLSLLNVFLGLGFAAFWAIGFFIPNPSTTVMLAVIDKLDLEQSGGN